MHIVVEMCVPWLVMHVFKEETKRTQEDHIIYFEIMSFGYKYQQQQWHWPEVKLDRQSSVWTIHSFRIIFCVRLLTPTRLWAGRFLNWPILLG